MKHWKKLFVELLRGTNSGRNYTLDWSTVKHIYFIAEIKGSMSTMDLRPIEQAKIDCARKLFNNISTSKVRYEAVYDYELLSSNINS